MTPDKHTNQEVFLDVGDGHQIYVHDWGQPTAKLPIVFVHGGPGSGASDRNKAFFEPVQQRVIFFDQRGAGRSLPQGSLEHNTTAELIEDIEKIAQHLQLRKFILTGNSWGSCLSLAYTLKYPKRVATMVLRGIFTGSQAEIDWVDKGGYREFFPEVWQSLLDQTPSSHTSDPVSYHQRRILGPDNLAAKNSAYIYGNVEAALMRLDDRFTTTDSSDFDASSGKIEAHYMTNRCFMPDRHIMDNAHQLTMPVWLIQGRYDMVCPPITAWELHKQLPKSELIWTTAGHSGNDRAGHDVYRTLLLQLARES
jgi:proline iminopeptidase